MCESSAKIEVIQGDSVDRIFTLFDENDTPVNPDMVSAVFFTCRGVHFQQKLEYDAEAAVYMLSIPYVDTAKMAKGHWTYDITVKFIDTKRQTATYCGPFEVLQKVNAVNYGEG